MTTFYEDDEPVEKVKAAFDAGVKGLTAPPSYGRTEYLSLDKVVIDDYEARFLEYEDKVNNLAADLLEEQAQRREVGEALVRVTEERDELREAIDRLRRRAVEHSEQHQKIFTEWARERTRLVGERDEARDEVVRLGRELEQWKQAFGDDGVQIANAILRLPDEVSDATSRLRAALDEERIEGDQG